MEKFSFMVLKICLIFPSYIENRSITVGASRGEKVVVVRLAIGVALAFEKVPGTKLLIAVRAGKVLRMPCLAQSGDNLKPEEKKNKSLFTGRKVISVIMSTELWSQS